MTNLLQLGTDLMQKMDSALKDYERYNIKEAEADHALTEAEAKAILDDEVADAVVKVKEAHAALKTAKEKWNFLEARSRRQIADKALDAATRQLSFVQTAMKQQQIEYNATMNRQMNDN